MYSMQRQHLQELVQLWANNLNYYERQAASYDPSSVPLELSNNIQHAKRQIKDIEERLLSLDDRPGETIDIGEEVGRVIALFLRVDRQIGEMEQRIMRGEQKQRQITARLYPSVRRMLAIYLSSALMTIAAILWLVYEIRQYYLANPPQAIVITVAILALAFLIRWLPEPEDGER